jgi:SAM domain (Sterile alpha motif)
VPPDVPGTVCKCMVLNGSWLCYTARVRLFPAPTGPTRRTFPGHPGPGRSVADVSSTKERDIVSVVSIGGLGHTQTVDGGRDATDCDWLNTLGLGQYAQRFAENYIDASVLRDLTDQDLEKIGIRPGHRKKLLRAIRELADACPAAPPPAAASKPAPHDSAERRRLTVMFCDKSIQAEKPAGTTAGFNDQTFKMQTFKIFQVARYRLIFAKFYVSFNPSRSETQ